MPPPSSARFKRLGRGGRGGFGWVSLFLFLIGFLVFFFFSMASSFVFCLKDFFKCFLGLHRDRVSSFR